MAAPQGLNGKIKSSLSFLLSSVVLVHQNPFEYNERFYPENNYYMPEKFGLKRDKQRRGDQICRPASAADGDLNGETATPPLIVSRHLLSAGVKEFQPNTRTSTLEHKDDAVQTL